MGNPQVLSGRKVILLSALLLSALLLSAGVGGTLIGRILGAALQTSPAWIGPAILIGSIALALVGVLLLPAAIREFKAVKRGPAA